MKVVKETWERTKLEFSSSIFCVSDTVLGAGVVGQWHHRPHRPCTVAWLTVNTHSAVTMQWADMAGEQRLCHLIWKGWCWSSFSFRWSLATWCEELTHWKRPYAGKDWRQEKKRTIEDEMVGWHRWFNRHELGQTPVDSEGKGSLACCSPQGCKESDST